MHSFKTAKKHLRQRCPIIAADNQESTKGALTDGPVALYRADALSSPHWPALTVLQSTAVFRPNQVVCRKRCRVVWWWECDLINLTGPTV